MDLASLLPHAPPMRLLSSIEQHDASAAECHATLQADCPFADPDGNVDPMICIELVAQGAAVLAALGAGAGARPTPGVIASCRQALFADRALCVGDTVRVLVTRVAGDASFGSFDGTVLLGEHEVATISLGVVLGAEADPSRGSGAAGPSEGNRGTS